jgi:hypothetical protein
MKDMYLLFKTTQHEVAIHTVKMFVADISTQIGGIKAKLHSKYHRDIGKAWATEWTYPKNELFDISVSPTRMTLFDPSKMYLMKELRYISQEEIDNNNDKIYIISGIVKHHMYGTMKVLDDICIEDVVDAETNDNE